MLLFLIRVSPERRWCCVIREAGSLMKASLWRRKIRAAMLIEEPAIKTDACLMFAADLPKRWTHVSVHRHQNSTLETRFQGMLSYQVSIYLKAINTEKTGDCLTNSICIFSEIIVCFKWVNTLFPGVWPKSNTCRAENKEDIGSSAAREERVSDLIEWCPLIGVGIVSPSWCFIFISGDWLSLFDQ